MPAPALARIARNHQIRCNRIGVAARAAAAVLLILAAFAAAGCGHKVQVQAPQPSPEPPPAAPPLPAARPAAEPAPAAETARPAPQIPPTTVPTPEVPSSMPPSPPIRIGLSVSSGELRITAADPFYILEKRAEAQRQLVSGEVRVRVEEADSSTEVFRVQVASFSRPEGADNLQAELQAKFQLPIVIRTSSAGLKQVRIGDFPSRDEASRFASGRLAAAGYRDFLIVREAETAGREVRLALRGPQNLFLLSTPGFLIFPGSPTAPLQLDGKPYRGAFDLILNSNNRLTVVNQLGIEEYLLGVVPAEINPASYPEFAALAAQAVAARTYALKNLGRFRSEGFDLTADVRTQVYTGIAGEDESASEAVRQTFGVAVYYHGSLIDAMYSSTCGGRTEDFSNVFDGPDVPYLKSVLCAVENGSSGPLETELTGLHSWSDPILADDGSPANRTLELAQVSGFIPAGMPASSLAEPASRAEIRDWVARALAVSGKEGKVVEPGDVTARSGFLRCLADTLNGVEDVNRRISNADAAYYLGNLRDGNDVPEADRRAFAFFIQTGLWHPFPDNTARPRDRIRRGDALALLMRWTESAQPAMLRTGLFVAAGAPAGESGTVAAVSIKSGRQTLSLALSRQVRLYRTAGGRSMPVERLKLIGNERMAYHVGRDGTIDFLEIELNPTGAASDRFSPVASWETRLTRATIAGSIKALAGNIGEFRDLKPARTGSSGRAVRIEVIGTKGSVILNGYKVRNALGLRDTLFTIDRARNAEGAIESFTFHGRGWGHGVGMCQVGAYGMARAGRSFEEILKTYYTGVELKKAY
jgi:stage II sporulation protein D